MKIGIDGRALQGKRAGVGRYTFEICKSLDILLPDAEFYVYSQVPVTMPASSTRWHARVEPLRWASRLKSALWLKLRVRGLSSSDNLDVFWATATLSPTLAPSVRMVCTVHDLNFILVPESMSTPGYLAARIFFERDMRRANVVTTISKGTADRLRTHFGIAVQGIALPAVSELFRPCSGPEIATALEKHGLEAPYLLAVGTLEPRKNFQMLLDAFVLLKKRYPSLPHKLALVGGKGWKNSSLSREIGALGKRQVHHLGYVGDQDLPCIYSGASAFIFPSQYEGFGIPVLEARACGTPIITTDLPEIREAGGNGPLYITPSIEALAAALSSMLLAGGGIGDPHGLPTWRAAGEVLADLFQRELTTANNFKAATYFGH